MSRRSVQKTTTIDPQNTEHLQLTARPKWYAYKYNEF